MARDGQSRRDLQLQAEYKLQQHRQLPTYRASDGSLESNVATRPRHDNTLAPPLDAAPVNTVPGTQEIEANTSTAIAGLSIVDPDAASGSLHHHALGRTRHAYGVASVGGPRVGQRQRTVTLNGTLAQINTTLRAANKCDLSRRTRRLRHRTR